MILQTYRSAELSQAFGIDMSDVELGPVHDLGVGAGWGRVRPGAASDPHQHDEVETFVILAGRGDLVVDGARHPIGPGVVAQIESFETHVVENTGEEDLVFATFYWRDAGRRAQVAAQATNRRFGERPVFVFSTPPTPNGDLHLGHLSGPYLGADVFVRFQRLNGTRAWHLSGSDDYQSYTVGAARRDGTTPAEAAAHYSAEIAETLRRMDIELDQYTVTDADPGYREGLQDFFSVIVGSGRVSPRATPALFDGESGEYLYEVDVSGTCPSCGHGAGGNICEECGEPNLVADLKDPRSGRSAAQPRVGESSRWTLALHEFGDEVARHHHLGRVPVRLKELAARLDRRGSIDLPISHPSAWGVPPREEGAEGEQVIWVWPEMAYGFLHGIQRLGERSGQTWNAAAPEPDWKIVHFFGYDNSFYHGILYPVLYRLAHPGWQPDIDYHVNEFYLLENAKFSTSRRHGVWGKEILHPQTVDAVRWYLSRTRPEGRRTNFERPAFEQAVEQVLIGTWQTWLRELGSEIALRYDGKAPDAGTWAPEHTAQLALLNTRLAGVTSALGQDGFSLNRAVAEIEALVLDAVRFRAKESAGAGIAQWKDHHRTAVALDLAAARLLATATAPVMPRFSAALTQALGLPMMDEWPASVPLVPVGSVVGLSEQSWFSHRRPETVSGPTVAMPKPAITGDRALPWLEEAVRGMLGLSAGESLAGRSLLELGASSLQTIGLQYQVLQEFGVDLQLEELLSERDLAGLAQLLKSEEARA